MTSLKSIMERRAMQVLDVRDMKNLKGGVNANAAGNAAPEAYKETGNGNQGGGAGIPPGA